MKNLTQKIQIPKSAKVSNFQLIQGGNKVLEKTETGLKMYTVQNVGPKGVYCFCDSSDQELYITWDKF